MFSSLRSRLLFSFLIVIGVVLMTSALTLLVFVARSNLGTRLELRNVATRLLQRPDLELGRPALFDELVNRIDENTGYRTVIVDGDGVVLADSQADEQPALRAIRRIPADPLKEVFSIKDTEGKEWLYTGRRVPNGYALLILAARQPLRELLSSPISGELLRALAQAGGVALVLSLLLALLISQSVASPLAKISSAARQVAVGKQIAVQPEGPKEVRQLGQAFNEMSARLHASQQSQRDFVANVSHELKTPLTSIQGFAQAILDGTASTPEEQQQAAQVVYDESERMYRMVLDLLELARLDAGTVEFEMGEVDLGLLLQAVVERFAPQSSQAEVELVLAVEGLPPVTGDGDRLAQVFNNLVDNALKHTPPGGQVQLEGKMEGGQVLVSVKDNGPGIPEDELSRIFERFYQLDKSRRGGPTHGSGLGLAIANQIVHAHHGQISVRSIVGVGSEFIVRLPIVQPYLGTRMSN
ncbi:MAG TPA: HAMP domain-containing sensor histidine kinase [Anaerolineales bacterium]|jgi:signal transduction histidine kinase|nr:HAMP domain-containing sensor histidine kinase [Anaerolineales bacterium]